MLTEPDLPHGLLRAFAGRAKRDPKRAVNLVTCVIGDYGAA